MDMSGYKTSKNKQFRFIFIINDKNSKTHGVCRWRLNKAKNNSWNLENFNCFKKKTYWKRKWSRAEFYKFVFRNFLEVKNRHHHSKFTDEGPSIAERFISTIRNLLMMKSVLEKRKADSVTKLPSVKKNYNNTIHSSTKPNPIQTSRNLSETTCYCSFNDRRKRCKPSGSLGGFYRNADISSRRLSRTGGGVEVLEVPMY